MNMVLMKIINFDGEHSHYKEYNNKWLINKKLFNNKYSLINVDNKDVIIQSIPVWKMACLRTQI